MTKKLFLLVVIYFVTNFSFAQYNEWSNGKIYFKDGKVLDGLVRLKIIGQDQLKPDGGNEKVRFKANRKDRSKYYKAKDVDYIEIETEYREKVKGKYVEKKRKAIFIVINKNTKGTKKGFAELLINGKVKLVQRLAFPKNGSGVVKAYTEKLILREGEKAISLTPKLFKAFKNWASEFFSDCPEIVKKIENKQLSKDDIPTIVNYYNENCSLD